jgi:hypothetical protein
VFITIYFFSNVFIVIYGENSKTEKIPLKVTDKNPFEKGKTDTFIVAGSNVGDVKKINMSHDGLGVGDGWYLDQVTVSVNGKNYR